MFKDTSCKQKRPTKGQLHNIHVWQHTVYVHQCFILLLYQATRQTTISLNVSCLFLFNFASNVICNLTLLYFRVGKYVESDIGLKLTCIT